MENSNGLVGRWLLGAMTALCGFFAPIGVLCLCACIFVFVDFVLGVWASREGARRKGAAYLDAWGFESVKAWRTIYKLVFILVAICLVWVLDEFILTNIPDLHLANYMTAFVCGVELWSFLENAAVISDYKLFKGLQRFMKKKVEDSTGIDIELPTEDKKKEE